MEQVSKLKEEIHQLESKKAELTLAKEKAENDVKEKIKDIDKVKQLNEETRKNTAEISQKNKDKQPLLKQKREKEELINKTNELLNKALEKQKVNPNDHSNNGAILTINQTLDVARKQLKEKENELKKVEDEIE
ncbi:hypothetical protein IMK14_06435, partial [Sneathia sp. DSM 16630]|nr:hypothetical protein [Sneathia sp. DSM 16630]